jgi:hypothetical protein
MKIQNPFLLNEYGGPQYFCNRVKETKELEEAAINGRDITLYALRRMGKSGLIEHTGQRMVKKHGFSFIYSDIYHVTSTTELLEALTNQILGQLKKKKGWLESLLSYLKHMSPMLSYDDITGIPQVSLTNVEGKSIHKSLEAIFQILEEHSNPVYWAWDEFQQLNQIENSEGIIKKIRGLVQKSKNIRFVFSGSHTTMLLSMFNSSKQAFYRSTQLMELKEIEVNDYQKFITKHFVKARKTISKQALDSLQAHSLNHTWYVQALCNRLFQKYNEVDLQEVNNSLVELIKENETHFYRFRKLLTSLQWKLLVALAKEEKVAQPTSSRFINQHDLVSSASVLRAINKLIKDEFVVELWENDQKYYRVNDVFLIRWVQWRY